MYFSTIKETNILSRIWKKFLLSNILVITFSFLNKARGELLCSHDALRLIIRQQTSIFVKVLPNFNNYAQAVTRHESILVDFVILKVVKTEIAVKEKYKQRAKK